MNNPQKIEITFNDWFEITSNISNLDLIIARNEIYYKAQIQANISKVEKVKIALNRFDSSECNKKIEEIDSITSRLNKDLNLQKSIEKYVELNSLFDDSYNLLNESIINLSEIDIPQEENNESLQFQKNEILNELNFNEIMMNSKNVEEIVHNLPYDLSENNGKIIAERIILNQNDIKNTLKSTFYIGLFNHKNVLNNESLSINIEKKFSSLININKSSILHFINIIWDEIITKAKEKKENEFFIKLLKEKPNEEMEDIKFIMQFEYLKKLNELKNELEFSTKTSKVIIEKEPKGKLLKYFDYLYNALDKGEKISKANIIAAENAGYSKKSLKRIGEQNIKKAKEGLYIHRITDIIGQKK